MYRNSLRFFVFAAKLDVEMHMACAQHLRQEEYYHLLRRVMAGYSEDL